MVLYKSQVRKLPRPVQEYMRRKFNLPAEYLGILRCLKKVVVNGGEQDRISISIFSPVRAHEHRMVIKSAADLRRYPEMVLFKGRIDSRGVHITDRRGPAWGLKIRRQ